MAPIPDEPIASHTPIVNDEAKGCCIAGSGPAGAMLALLLARRGVPVTLLEMHHDFDREFRDDDFYFLLISFLSLDKFNAIRSILTES